MPGPAKRARILIIMEHRIGRELLSLQLRQMEYQTLTAAKIAEGEASAATEIPDLIIMDPAFPGKKGTAAAARLKQNPKTTSIPIIAYSGLDDDIYKTEARKAGIAEFLTIPTAPEIMRSVIEKHLAQKGMSSGGTEK
jgi:CheY-like chemotaxis protein